MRDNRLPLPAGFVVPGTPFGIEVLKVAFMFLFLVSLMGVIPGLRSMHSGYFALVVNNNRVSRLWSLGYALLFGVGFYGVHRKMRIAWKVGWFYLALFYLESIVSAMASTIKLSTSDRWIASAFVVVSFSAVAAYWARWWHRQKGYFIPGSWVDLSKKMPTPD
jgi:hypothetical protein